MTDIIEGHYSAEVEAEIERRANAIANTHLAIAADPRGAQKRHDEINAREVRQREEEAGAKRAAAKRSQELDERQAKLDAQKESQDATAAELAALDVRVHERKAAVEIREHAVSEEGILAECRKILREVRSLEGWYATMLENLSGLSSRYHGILQPRRTLPQLAEEIAHDLRSAEPDPAFHGEVGDTEVLAVENLMSGTSLSRSGTRRGAAPRT
jgi:hypothetical protein